MINFKSQSGFSLVETLVAVSLLLIIIVGPMSITARTAKSSTFASEQIQAFFLAQEGLELAQKARDDLLLEWFKDNLTGATPPAEAWTKFTDSSGIYQQCYDSNGCGLEWHTTNDGELASPVDCSGTACQLYISSSDKRSMFTHALGGGNTKTPFTRKIYFTNSPSGDDYVHIRSEVTWRTGSIIANQKVEVDTYLYNTHDTP